MRPLVSSALGRVLQAVFGALLLIRRPKPVHARGVIVRGSLVWHPRRQRSGLSWVDDPPDGARGCIARVSRSLGLPAPLPDVIGLALRFDHAGRPADLELASTGFGVPSRFLLAPQRSPSRARLGTLFPYRGTDGPVLLCARTMGPADLPVDLGELAERLEHETWRLRLFWARPGGRWHGFAELLIDREPGVLDRGLRFDAVEHPLPGTDTYPWVRAVREPSYRLARRFR